MEECIYIKARYLEKGLPFSNSNILDGSFAFQVLLHLVSSGAGWDGGSSVLRQVRYDMEGVNNKEMHLSTAAEVFCGIQAGGSIPAL